MVTRATLIGFWRPGILALCFSVHGAIAKHYKVDPSSLGSNGNLVLRTNHRVGFLPAREQSCDVWRLFGPGTWCSQ